MRIFVFGRSDGSTVCLACGPGRYSHPGAWSCTRCARGTYSGAAMAESCVACPAGKTMHEDTIRSSVSECLQICPPGEAAMGTVNGVGAGVCEICAAGKFNAVDGATHCSDCPRATYSAARASSCTACPQGTTTYPRGGNTSSSCLGLCAAGSYSISGGGAACTLCEVGKYNTEAGATNCASCPAGMSTEAAGMTSCLGFCQPGNYGNLGLQVCSECPAGKHAQGVRASQCDACPAGTFSAAAASVCTVCPPGYSAASASSAGKNCEKSHL